MALVRRIETEIFSSYKHSNKYGCGVYAFPEDLLQVPRLIPLKTNPASLSLYSL
jgi:hypothetical protein